jgi:hypothetical protein
VYDGAGARRKWEAYYSRAFKIGTMMQATDSALEVCAAALHRYIKQFIQIVEILDDNELDSPDLGTAAVSALIDVGADSAFELNKPIDPFPPERC